MPVSSVREPVQQPHQNLWPGVLPMYYYAFLLNKRSGWMPIGSKPCRPGCLCLPSTVVTLPSRSLRMWPNPCMKLAGLLHICRLHPNPYLFYMVPLLRNSHGHYLLIFLKSSHLIMESSSLRMQPGSSAIRLCCNGCLSEVWIYAWQTLSAFWPSLQILILQNTYAHPNIYLMSL